MLKIGRMYRNDCLVIDFRFIKIELHIGNDVFGNFGIYTVNYGD